jgi:hypothetical protein
MVESSPQSFINPLLKILSQIFRQGQVIHWHLMIMDKSIPGVVGFQANSELTLGRTLLTLREFK